MTLADQECPLSSLPKQYRKAFPHLEVINHKKHGCRKLSYLINKHYGDAIEIVTINNNSSIPPTVKLKKKNNSSGITTQRQQRTGGGGGENAAAVSSSSSSSSTITKPITNRTAHGDDDSTMTSPTTASSDTMTFDYIIVGSGPSAIGILYGLLEKYAAAVTSMASEDVPGEVPFSIAVVERGGGGRSPHCSKNSPLTKSPHRWYEAAHSDDCSVMYKSTITRRVLDIPVGKGIGGSSNINACLCIPPLQDDFMEWEEPWKSSLYSSSVYIQTILRQNGVLHDHPFSSFSMTSSLKKSMMKDVTWNANVQTLVTKKGQQRCNYYDALVQPLLDKYPFLAGKIRWFTGYECQRLIVDNDNSSRVVGVECSCYDDDDGDDDDDDSTTMISIHAKRRTILCAGAIETPVLLLVSDIEVDGIGRNLKDQLLLARTYFKIPHWISSSSNDGRKNENQQRQQQQSTNGIAAIGHYRHDTKCESSTRQQRQQQQQQEYSPIYQIAITDDVAAPSIVPSAVAMAFRWNVRNKLIQPVLESVFQFIKICLKGLILYTPIGFLLRHFTTTALIFLMHPKSCGTITIQPRRKHNGDDNNNNNNDDSSSIIRRRRRRDVTVHIDPGYLHNEEDLLCLEDVWYKTSLPSPFLEVFPGFLFTSSRSKARTRITTSWGFRLYCHCFLQPYYHYAGSCQMRRATTPSRSETTVVLDNKENNDDDDNDNDNSHNKSWVVHPSNLQVRNYEGLYICDASILPTMVSNPPALTLCGLGYQFATQIIHKEDSSVQHTKNI
jgi:hypothetical protein